MPIDRVSKVSKARTNQRHADYLLNNKFSITTRSNHQMPNPSRGAADLLALLLSLRLVARACSRSQSHPSPVSKAMDQLHALQSLLVSRIIQNSQRSGSSVSQHGPSSSLKHGMDHLLVRAKHALLVSPTIQLDISGLEKPFLMDPNFGGKAVQVDGNDAAKILDVSGLDRPLIDLDIKAKIVNVDYKEVEGETMGNISEMIVERARTLPDILPNASTKPTSLETTNIIKPTVEASKILSEPNDELPKEPKVESPDQQNVVLTAESTKTMPERLQNILNKIEIQEQPNIKSSSTEATKRQSEPNKELHKSSDQLTIRLPEINNESHKSNANNGLPKIPFKQEQKFLKSARVPSTRIGRLFEFTTLGVGVGFGMVGESLLRATGISSNSSSLLLTSGNVERIVQKLSKMRGAALKLGQMLSIQDNEMIPKQIVDVLKRVQNSANYMPEHQLKVFQ